MRAFIAKSDIERFRKKIDNPIEFTSKIYYSNYFRETLQKYINDSRERIKVYEKDGSINRKSDLYRMYKRGHLTFEYFIGHCVLVYFNDDRNLSSSERRIVREFTGIVLDDYRRRRNHIQRKRRLEKRNAGDESFDSTSIEPFLYKDKSIEKEFVSAYISNVNRKVCDEKGKDYEISYILENSSFDDVRLPCIITSVKELIRRGIPVSVSSVLKFMSDERLIDGIDDEMYVRGMVYCGDISKFKISGNFIWKE